MKLRYSIIFALVAGLVGGALSGWIFFMAESRGAASVDIEKVKLWVQIFSVIVLVGSIGISSYFVRKQMVETQAWNRRLATRDMAESFADKFNKYMDRLNTLLAAKEQDIDILNQIYKDFIEKKEAFTQEEIELDNEISAIVTPILAGLENIAWGIKHDIYDNNLAYDMYYEIFAYICKWTENIIAFNRIGASNAGGEVWGELERLYEIWKTPSRKERNEKLLAYQSKSLEDL